MKAKRLFSLTLAIIMLSNVSVSAASLKTTITLGKEKIKDGNSTDCKGTIKYEGFVYKGFYRLELPATYVTDQEILSSSFSNANFVYSKKAKLSGTKSWVLAESFYDFGTTTKSVKVSILGTKAGKGKIWCGTGNNGDHELDKKTSKEIKVTE